MHYRITEIDFDFSDSLDDPLTDEYKQSIIDETIKHIWKASDADDLVDEITNATGWCVNSIIYCPRPSDDEANS